MNEDFKQRMEEQGYTELREVDGKVCGLFRFIFTWGVIINMDDIGYERRFCFDNYSFASKFLEEWDGVTEPVVGEDHCTAIK